MVTGEDVFMYFTFQMSSRQQSLPIVEYFAEHSGYKCGYCGSEDTNFSHGMWAHTLTTQDYQVGLLVCKIILTDMMQVVHL